MVLAWSVALRQKKLLPDVGIGMARDVSRRVVLPSPSFLLLLLRAPYALASSRIFYAFAPVLFCATAKSLAADADRGVTLLRCCSLRHVDVPYKGLPSSVEVLLLLAPHHSALDPFIHKPI